MKVVVCANGIFPAVIGGIQRHTRLLVETLASACPDLRIVVAHPHPGLDFFQRFPNVTETPVTPRPGKAPYLLETRALSGRMLDVAMRHPDAIVYSQGFAIWRNARKLATRLIVNPHGLEPFQSSGLPGRTWKLQVSDALSRRVSRATFQHARHVISLGGRLTDILHREVAQPHDRVVVIPNGVVPPIDITGTPETRDPKLPLRALFVGRLYENKGLPDLLAAMPLINEGQAAVPVHLDVVGDGPLFSSLKNAHASRKIIFHGSIGDAALDALFRQADVFVLPTLFEGMPTVVLEAMARGLPIIVTDVGATREMVDESNGIIIPKRNPAAVATALRRIAMLSFPARRAMGEASRRKVHERFTWPQVAAAHMRLFQSMHRYGLDS